MAKNYYEILGIDKKATKDDIKKAFHKLAHKYHPDKPTGDQSKFKEISEAYAVLSNDQKRAEYDAYGQTFNGAGPRGQYQGGFQDFDFSQFTQGGNFNFDMGDLGDIFGDMFGTRMREERPRGRDISIDLEIEFEESIFGVTRNVLLNKQSKCGSCKGSGGKAGTELKTCTACNGNGSIRESKRSFFGAINVVKTCDKCHGSGKVPKEQCETCKGNGVVHKQEEINISVPAGIQNGEVIRMSGLGEAIGNGTSGDLYVRIHVKKHKSLSREGSSLVSNLSIKISDAILGADYVIETLEGPLTIKIPAGIQFGEILRVRGRGVPVAKNKRGDLLIKITIAVPQKISKNAKKILEDLKKEGM